MYHLGWQTTKEKGHRSGEHESTAKHIHGHDEDGETAMKDRHPVPGMTGGDGGRHSCSGQEREEERRREKEEEAGVVVVVEVEEGEKRKKEGRRMRERQPDSLKTTALGNPGSRRRDCFLFLSCRW